MENNDILERFRTFDLPKLWTVTYPWRQASYAGNGDLVASDTTLKPQTEAELKQAVEHHLDWYNSGPSCFLSMFSDWRHCRNWASQRGDAGVYIIEVDITQLNHSYVFQAKHVTSELGILYSRSLEHEYFILHRIPRNAMKSRISLGEAEERGMMPIFDMGNDVPSTLACIGLMIFMDIMTLMRSAKCTMQMMTSWTYSKGTTEIDLLHFWPDPVSRSWGIPDIYAF
ncbi:hypothetical protein TSTA_066280 [Talaromyces stipitatus ATCC 10500]|uniref:DUF7587 domain-containing protein n=1 Tax=Talaromyces stipitatus (strain ATCC 10500 / CBS 375.48 / QM 6759 / NRRL 1006) TaxID=441959 RepID=B8LX96_TALSN|nr:uncharacterized protein TSTA_066280 [Talaromyces stipitatus ATCC 10500]EED23178.1 hypothetical protein TSTA_066280 [Talaromyces stipitatus ATCC 10500]